MSIFNKFFGQKSTPSSSVVPEVTRLPMSKDSLVNLAANLGNSKDKAAYAQYIDSPLQREQLTVMYRTSWLANAIIDAVADDMTRAWRSFILSDKNVDISDINKAEARLNVRGKVNEALRWARLYGGALLVMVIKGQSLNSPLIEDTIKQGDLLHLQVLDRYQVTGEGKVKELASPSFGLPEFYRVVSSGEMIHYSRVLRFNGSRLPEQSRNNNSGWDDSELIKLYDPIRHMDSINANIVSMTYEANVDVLKVPGFFERTAMEGGTDKLVERFALAAQMKSNNNMLLIDASEEYEKKSNSFSGLDKIFEQFAINICGAADIPMTRLFGRSPGGLNATGDSDIRNYYDMLSARQESDLRPQLEQLDQVLVRSIWGLVPEDLSFKFNSLWQESNLDKAQQEKLQAEVDQVYFNLGVISGGVIAQNILDRGAYPSMTEDDVKLVKELDEVMADPSVDNDNQSENQDIGSTGESDNGNSDSDVSA